MKAFENWATCPVCVRFSVVAGTYREYNCCNTCYLEAAQGCPADVALFSWVMDRLKVMRIARVLTE